MEENIERGSDIRVGFSSYFCQIFHTKCSGLSMGESVPRLGPSRPIKQQHTNNTSSPSSFFFFVLPCLTVKELFCQLPKCLSPDKHPTKIQIFTFIICFDIVCVYRM